MIEYDKDTAFCIGCWGGDLDKPLFAEIRCRHFAYLWLRLTTVSWSSQNSYTVDLLKLKAIRVECIQRMKVWRSPDTNAGGSMLPLKAPR